MMEETEAGKKTNISAGFRITPMLVLGIVVIFAVLGVIYVVVGSSSIPVVAAGDTVKVNYVGTFTNGTIFDSSAGRQPLEFTVGSGQVIKGFDQAVVGMKVNQEKTVTIPANEAYGPVNQALIIKVPRSTFGNQTVEPGMAVNESSNGQQAHGVITAVNTTTVTVDFNPLLAGQTLIFNITIVAIQKAT